MEKLIEQAQKLNAGLNDKIAEYKVAVAEANNTAASNRIFKDQLEEMKADIEGREAAIKDVESVQNLLAQVQKERSALSEEGVALETLRSDLNIGRLEYNKAMQQLKVDKDLVVNDRALLRKQQEELKVKTENYKDEVLNNLKASVK